MLLRIGVESLKYATMSLLTRRLFMPIAPSVIDLPSVGKSRQRPDHVVELVIASDEKVRTRVDGKDGDALPLRSVAAKVAELQAGDANTPVVISADRNVKYELVVKLMDTLQKAGVQRVGLSVKNAGGA